MEGKVNPLAKRILKKYKKVKIGETYEIDGKFYTLKNDDSDLYDRTEIFKEKLNKIIEND